MGETPQEHTRRKSTPARIPQASDEGAVTSAAKRASIPRGTIGPFLARVRHQSLSVRLLLLTALFVMVSEVLIYVPSIARFREGWLDDRLNTAFIATLAVEASPQWSVSDALRRDLLSQSGLKAASLKRDGRRELILPPDMAQMPTRFIDMRDQGALALIAQAADTLLFGAGRTVRVAGVPEMMDKPHTAIGDMPVIDIVFDETQLRNAMLDYSKSLLGVSILISLITGTLVYFVLDRVLVRPMRRLSDNMVRFRDNPEDAGRVIVPSGRTDEVGVAERALAEMQEDLRGALKQKSRLAALGAAVAKINHDLRNMLTTAQLFSDRVAASADPTVQRHLPKLMKALDRAISLTTETLRFGRAEEPPPRPRAFVLAEIVEEAGSSLPTARGVAVAWRSEVDPAFMLEADPDHVYRILLNLARNAAQAIEASGRDGRIRITAMRGDDGATIFLDIEDNGPGIPDTVRTHLFEAFASAKRGGGTGLGLTISRELARAHGGDIALVKSDANGTVFRVSLPDRARFH